jgi:small subunit ribosomal protein S20
LKKKIAKGRHASTQKRDRQSIKRRARNRSAMSRMKSVIKEVRATGSRDTLSKAIPLIMKTGRKGIIHRNTAARIKSKLARKAAKLA